MTAHTCPGVAVLSRLANRVLLTSCGSGIDNFVCQVVMLAGYPQAQRTNAGHRGPVSRDPVSSFRRCRSLRSAAARSVQADGLDDFLGRKLSHWQQRDLDSAQSLSARPNRLTTNDCGGATRG